MIFLDFEVFKEDWLAVFMDARKQEMKVIVNNADELTDYFNKNVDRIWIGYNSIRYDQYIMKGIMLGMNPTDINHAIINEKKQGWELSDEFWNIKMINYDAQVGFHGLKTLEGFLGNNIKETSVDFTIDRKLTQDELVEVMEYCQHDVEQLMEVFMKSQVQFQTKMSLIKEFDLPLRHIGSTNAQLSATVLDCTLQPRTDEWDFHFPKEIQLDKYEYIKRWYQNPVNHSYDKKLETEVSGVPFTFAWGGTHAAKPNYFKEGKFILADISSFYPSMMIEYNYYSRNMSSSDKFKEIYDERFRLREMGDNEGQEVMKLILNTTYGAMGAEFNKLYDPLMRNNVCVTGQLLLLDLAEKLEEVKGIELSNANTDGLLYKYETEEQLELFKSICEKWSKRTRMKIGYDEYVKVMQKDVNGYIALGEDRADDVYVGGYVKNLSDLDYDLPIINKALRSYFVEGIPVRSYIESENRLKEFQRIVKVSGKFDAATHNKVRLQERTLRVFASRNSADGQVASYRFRDGKASYNKFSNTSDNSFIDNGDVNDKLIPRRLDKEWYIELAIRRVNQFKGEVK